MSDTIPLSSSVISTASSLGLMNSSNPSNTFSMTEATQHLDFWREFDLDSRRLALDKCCIEMKEMKSNSIVARKRLNEITKSFRAKSKDEQMTMMSDVLREYQEEIDQLSKRAKYSENAFYNLYKALYEAPDPVYIIEQLINTVSNSSTHQLEIERLRSELTQYDEEFRQLKNQDITIRRLEEQLQEYREKIEDKVAEEVLTKSMEAEQKADARIAEIKEIQRVAERRLAASLESMRQAQLSADRAQSQLFEVTSQAESRISGLQAENAILAEGAQRSNSRIAELERMIEQLQSNQSSNHKSSLRSMGSSSISSSSSSSSSSNNNPVDDTEDGKVLNQMIIADLRAESQKKDEALRSERLKHESSLRDMISQLNKERELVGKLRQEIADRPPKEDFIAMKRQLRVLQRVVFNIQDDDTEDSKDDMNPENTSDKIQFELLLSSKLKTLEAELAETRRNLAESREQEKLAISTASSLKSSLEASTALVQRLEADLELRTSKSSKLSLSRNISNDPTQGLAELLDSDISTRVKLSSETINGNSKDSSKGEGQAQLVSILQAQRDRYKERLAQVENNLILSQQQLETMTALKTQLETDNLSLYSKIRFLQSYGTNNNSGSGSSSYGMGGNRSSMKSMKLRSHGNNQSGFDEEFGFGSSDQQQDVERRYQTLYEQGISPFQEFSQFERQRKLNELSVADRIVLNTTMAVVSSHMGRNFLLIYLGLMHLLVFATLYYSAHYVHYGCDPAIDHLIHKHQQDLVNHSAAVASSIVEAVRRHIRQ